MEDNNITCRTIGRMRQQKRTAIVLTSMSQKHPRQSRRGPKRSVAPFFLALLLWVRQAAGFGLLTPLLGNARIAAVRAARRRSRGAIDKYDSHSKIICFHCALLSASTASSLSSFTPESEIRHPSRRRQLRHINFQNHTKHLFFHGPANRTRSDMSSTERRHLIAKKDTARRSCADLSGSKLTKQDNNSSSNNRQGSQGQPKKQHRSSSSPKFNQWLQRLIKQNPSKAQLGEDALWQRIQAEEERANFDTVSFNIIMNGYARQRSVHAAKKADRLLQELLQLQQKRTHLQADTYSYAAVLTAHAKSKGGKTAALRAEELLIQMETSLFPAHSNAVLGTDVCHNAVMDAWSVSGDSWAGERAERWLRKLDSPSRISYNSCLKAYSRSQAPMEAQRLLTEMKTLANSTHPQLEPDKISVSTCIDAWARWTKNFTYAAQQAELLLVDMERDFEQWNKTATQSTDGAHSTKYHHKSGARKQPDIVTYTSVLNAFARSGMAEASDKALDLLRRMERFSDERPNAAFFNTFINLLSKSKDNGASTSKHKAPELADAILVHMKDKYRVTGNKNIRPCKITYTAIISVYASHFRRQKDAIERAESLLCELLELYEETGLEAYLPNAKTFGAVLSVWAKAACTTMDEGDNNMTVSADWFSRSQTLLEQMRLLYERTGCEELKPTSILYGQIFRILANGRDPNAAKHGLSLMKQMKEMTNERTKDGYGQHIHLDATMYAYLIVTFTKSRVDNGVELATRILDEVEEGYAAGMGNLKPTSLLYSSVLQAYAKSSSKEGAVLAEALLTRTKTLYKRGKFYAKPTVLFYNSVIDAHARSHGGRASALRAEVLLAEIEQRGRAGDLELSLTTRSFNAAILAWKNSNEADAPKMAELLLKKMNERYKAGDKKCRPDRVTINTVIGTWAKSSEEGAALRAEEWLHFLENLNDSDESDDPLKPDRYSYNSVIAAYSRSPMLGAATKAQALYERMQYLYEAGEELRPDLITYTSLRKAWMASNNVDAQRRVEAMILKEVDQQRKNSQSSIV